jgi:dolichol-phosphate mannosyltransferase
MNSNIATTAARSSEKSKLSIVIPAFNEQGNIEKIYEELMKIIPKLGMQWEIVFSDDGSNDNTWRIILGLHSKDSRVCGIRLSRNFGHQYALIAGLMNASGDAIITMDADLQHPPEIISQMLERWRNGDKIVSTVRLDNKEISFFKKMTSNLFYKIFTYLSGVKIHPGMSDFRLMDRQVLTEILRFKEQGLFLRGIVQWIGYQHSTITFRCGTRYSGETKYTLVKMLRFAWHGISSFSLVPLRLAIVLGLFSSTISFMGIGYAIYSKIIAGTAVPGWASVVAMISVFFGLLFIFLGILGEYIGRILTEARSRPRFIIDGITLSPKRSETES